MAFSTSGFPADTDKPHPGRESMMEGAQNQFWMLLTWIEQDQGKVEAHFTKIKITLAFRGYKTSMIDIPSACTIAGL